MLAETHEQLADAVSQAAAPEQELLKAETRSVFNLLSAPVNGTVRQLAVHTIGEVTQTGERLMIVVPDDGGLEIEAFVLNRDKGFVVPGQQAEVKLEAFSFTRYGTLPGTVLAVAEDVVEDEQNGPRFPARIALERVTMHVNGREVPLTPGMAATVEVKTGERRVIEYLLSPLLRYRDESLRER